MRMLMLLSLLFVLPIGIGAAQGATIHVPQDEPTIQAGIDAAQAGDVVLVACGTYFEHDILMKSGVRLMAEEAGCVVIDAQRLGRVIACDAVDATASIEGFVLTGGYASAGPDPRGGALLLRNSSPGVVGCMMQDNEGENGGGGIYAAHCESVIEDCVFARNAGVDGGGIFLNYASPVIRGCTLHDNDCLFWGGGIFCENYSTPLIENCTIVRNEAYQGGGIWCVNESHARLVNSIVAFSTDGDGIYAYPDYGHESLISVVCCDVYGNIDANYGGTLEDQTGINGNISVDPIFCDPANDDFRLAAGSPCLPWNNDCQTLMGAQGQGCPTVGLDDLAAAAAGSLRASPNPFAGGTRVSFRLASEEAVRLTIHDAAGRRVRELVGGTMQAAGVHEMVWDGNGDDGRAVPSGVYLCRFESGSAARSATLILTR